MMRPPAGILGTVEHTISGLALLLVTALLPAMGQSLSLGSWQTISSMRTTRDIDIDWNGTLWVATSGGVYAYNPNTDEKQEYRNINALQSLDARIVLCDTTTKQVVVGHADGAMDILDSTGRWTPIADIKRAMQYPRRGITSLRQNGRVLMIGTEFGLTLFDLNTRLFIETVDRIGTLQEKTRVTDIALFRDSVWLSTDSGIAVAPLNSPTLRLPSVWKILDASNGLPRTSYLHIVQNGSGVYACTDTVVYNVAVSGSEQVGRTDYRISSLSALNNNVYFSTIGGVATTNGPVNINWTPGEFIGHKAVMMNGVPCIVGFINGTGINVWDGTSVHPKPIGGPGSNQFAHMRFDSHGVLWVATDIEPPSKAAGVTIFDGMSWKSVTVREYPELQSNSCYRISALKNNRIMIGTWGTGGILGSYANGDVDLRSYTVSNSAVQGIPKDSNFCLIADAVSDASGNTWAVNEFASTQVLVKIDDSGNSSGVANCTDARSNSYRTIAIDGAMNKWMGSTAGLGLLIWNDKGTDNRADDICNVVRTSNSQLPDNVIYALATDRTGALWIGTARGVAVIAYPASISNTSVPYVRRITALSASVINDIFVDALNYKWVATNAGVFVLNEDGTQVLAEVTKSNTPLLDDNVRTVAVHPETGLAYMGTTLGCSVVQTSSKAPSQTLELSVFPQPFEQSKHSEVIIDGLAADSELRILTPGGVLVQALTAKGRQAAWDGRDAYGNEVPPGVYIVHVTSAVSKESGVTKIAVRR